MASPIEHFLVMLSSAIVKKHNDDDLGRFAKRVASECSSAGFPEENGFTLDHPNNKSIRKITREMDKKYKLFWYKDNNK